MARRRNIAGKATMPRLSDSAVKSPDARLNFLCYPRLQFGFFCKISHS